MIDYQRVVEREEYYWGSLAEFDWIEEASIKDILLFLSPLYGDVLELCAGSGTFTRHIPASFRSYTCLDISQPMLDTLQKKLPHLRTVRGNAENPDFPEASFDAILVFGGLHHLPNMELTITNRLLKNFSYNVS